MVRGHEKLGSFEEGELVIKRVIVTSYKVKHKPDEKHTGPYEISRIFHNNVTFEVQSLVKEIEVFQVHYNYLRPWKV